MSPSSLPVSDSVITISVADVPAISHTVWQERSAVNDRTAAQLASLMEELGIPGRISIEVELMPEAGPRVTPISLRIDRSPFYFPDELVLQAYAYAVGTPSAPLQLPAGRTTEIPEQEPET